MKRCSTAALDPLFMRWFGTEARRGEWFLTLQEPD